MFSKKVRILFRINKILLFILFILLAIAISMKAYDYGYDIGTHLWDNFYEKEIKE